MNANYSSLILKYTAKLKKKPESSVFAPLAEIYIKMGQFEDALKILKKGLQQNPHSVYGFICLSECYAERGEDDLSCATLAPLVHKYPENLKLQQLFGDSAYKLGKYAEALNSYKNILFLNPRAKEVSLQVKKLEEYLSQPTIISHRDDQRRLPTETIDSSYFPVEDLDHTANDESIDKWVQMDISPHVKEPENGTESISVSPVKAEEIPAYLEVAQPKEKQESTSYFHTSSMLDIYITQKLWIKAEELVKELLQTGPSDIRQDGLAETLKEKQAYIQQQLVGQIDINQSSGEQLMDIFDQKIKNIEPQAKANDMTASSVNVIKKAKLLKFLEKVKERATRLKS